MGSGPDSTSAAGGAPDCISVAGPRPSDAGEGTTSPYRAKPGSGREHTRVGSCQNTACTAEGAPGGKGVSWLKPGGSGEGAA